MAASHTPFAVWNRTVNPIVRTLLRSPAHRLLDGRLLLITVTGRRTGRAYTLPVEYRREGEHVSIPVGWPERKRWWRNLIDGGIVSLVLEGVERTGQARAVGDEESGVVVEVELDPLEAR